MLGSLIGGTDENLGARLLKHQRAFIKDIEVQPH